MTSTRRGRARAVWSVRSLPNTATALVLLHSYDEIARGLTVANSELDNGRKPVFLVMENVDLATFVTKVAEDRFGGDATVLVLDSGVRGLTAHARRRWFLLAIMMRAIGLRRFYRDHLKALTNSRVFFFSRYASPWAYYFVRRLYRQNEIVFWGVFSLRRGAGGRPLIDRSFVARWLAAKVVFGVGVSFMGYTGKWFELFPARFLHRSATSLTQREGERKYGTAEATIQVDTFRNHGFRLLYFDQPLCQSGRVTPVEYARTVRQMFETISRHVTKNEIGVKSHPGRGAGVFEYGVEIPRYIPAECLYSDSVSAYISFSSGAIANLRHGLAISMLLLVEFIDQRAKAEIVSRLERRCRADLVLPSSFAELDALIGSLG